MPRKKGSGKKNEKSRTTTTSDGQLSTGTTRTPVPRGRKNQPTTASKESPRTTRSARNNKTVNPPPPKCQRRSSTHEQVRDDSSSSKDEEDFDDTPLTKANIPKIIEAVFNQFGHGSQDDDQENPNLGEYLYRPLFLCSSRVTVRVTCNNYKVRACKVSVICAPDAIRTVPQAL